MAYDKVAKAAYQAAWNHQRKLAIRAMVRAAKDRPCADCGREYPYWVMDFDHVRGVKLLSIAKAVTRSYSFEAVADEIAKCDVVCANCHRTRTHERGEARNAHLRGAAPLTSSQLELS